MKRITKKQWTELGGLRNSQLARKETNGRWYYYLCN